MSPNEHHFYAVYNGRHLRKPTIFASWAQVHPRVIGYDAEDHKGFATLHEARESFEKRGIAEYEEAPECSSKCERVLNSEQGVYYYAVAYGKTVGVFNTWKDAKPAVEGFKSACHQKFHTEREARKFIELWQDAYSKVWQEILLDKLRSGWLPPDLAFNTTSIWVNKDRSEPKQKSAPMVDSRQILFTEQGIARLNLNES